MNENSDPYWDVSRVSSYIETLSSENLPRNDIINCIPIGECEAFRRLRPGMYSTLLSGSRAEFFIEPLQMLYGDIDIMYSDPFRIVYIGDFPSMPCDVRGFQERVIALHITNTGEFPGYCQLIETGKFEFSMEKGKYRFIPLINAKSHVDPFLKLRDEESSLLRQQHSFIGRMASGHRQGIPPNILKQDQADKSQIKGPAYNIGGNTQENDMGVDTVACVWCPEWPTEANEWPIRHREFDWPTKAMIQNVVRGGCHFVPVSHSDCPEETRKYQFRFSFSHAELLLIRSWEPVQQVVYHILREFCKNVVFKKNCSKEDEILTGYHLKTTMLWISEDYPKTWWHSKPVLVILSHILCTLGTSLRSKNIPNYFMPQVNLLLKTMNMETFNAALRVIDEFSNSVILSKCFLDEYITPHYKMLIANVQMKVTNTGTASNKTMEQLMTPISTPTEFDLKTVDTIKNELLKEQKMVRFQKSLLRILLNCMSLNYVFIRKDMGRDLKRTYTQCFGSPPKGSLERIIQNEDQYLRGFQPINADVCLKLACFQQSSQFRAIGSALLLLHVENNIACKSLTFHSESVVDMIRGIQLETKTMCLKSHNYPFSYRSKLQPSHVLLLRTQEVMETITCAIRDSEFQVMSQIALLLLKQCLETYDTESDSIRWTALVYMAALHYAVLNNQAAIHLCSLAMCAFAQRESPERHTKALNAFCLLFIDDVARITGFFLLLKRIQNPQFFAQQRLYSLLRISPRVFTEYIFGSATGRFPEFSDFLRRFNFSHFYLFDILLMILAHGLRLRSKHLRDRNESHRCDVPRCVYLRTELTAATIFRQIKTPEEKTTNPLFEWCLHEMTTFAEDVLHKWGIVYPCDCYRALYLYKSGEYIEVIELCEEILLADDNGNTTSKWSLLFLTVLPPFDRFFDKDIQFLLGLQTLCMLFYPTKEEVKLYRHGPDNFERIALAVKSGMILSGVGGFIDSAKNLCCLTKHFLAKYLLLMTAIATGQPRSHVFSAYRQINSRLHFERVIHKFVYRHLHRKFKS